MRYVFHLYFALLLLCWQSSVKNTVCIHFYDNKIASVLQYNPIQFESN